MKLVVRLPVPLLILAPLWAACGGSTRADGDPIQAGGGGVATGGGVVTGGLPSTGGSMAGAAAVGATGGAAGAPVVVEPMECDEEADCELQRMTCGCAAVPVGSGAAADPLPCEDDWCVELGLTEEAVTCLRGRCSLAIDCDRSHVSCEIEAPACSSGEAASVVADCWGPCVPLDECVPAWLVASGDPIVDWATIEGVWLLGWEGDLTHFSAIRFAEGEGPMEGELQVLAVPELPANDGYFTCSGAGSWYVNSMIGSYSIALPPDCGLRSPGTSLTFLGFDEAFGRWGSTLHATVELWVGGDDTTYLLEAFWFPADACNADLTDCDFGAL